MMITDKTEKDIGNAGPFSFSKGQKVYLAFKRLIDLGGSFVGILLFGLPMAVIAVVTRCTSKGPALYKQVRLGKDEKPFTMLKFRSMRADAPSIAPADMAPGEQEHLITKWGHFLRKTSLDELPQLFNIFIGQMSFIGPRPQQDKEHELKLYNARREFNPTASSSSRAFAPSPSSRCTVPTTPKRRLSTTANTLERFPSRRMSRFSSPLSESCSASENKTKASDCLKKGFDD